MKDFRNLKAWGKAHELTLKVYSVSKTFPRDEAFGLTSQLRRACASIPANIAEGCGRNGDVELARFLSIAAGSASEVEYHLLLAHDLNYLNHAEYNQLDPEVNELKRMLTAFIYKLKANS
ncbi:MAG TPA: four helix bundle protein [Pyrinomonadaceae bacterium]|nr:four helix bundle protein [Pyrinomonadaceae bacterium]